MRERIARSSPVRAARRRADALAASVRRRRDANDPELNRAIRQVVRYLPAAIQRQCDAIWRGRVAVALLVVGYPLFYLSGLVRAVVGGAAAPSVAVPAIVVAVGIAASVVMTARAMDVAAATTPILCLMMPEAADRIQAAFGERGVADVAAPWIRRRPGVATRATRAIGGGIGRRLFPTGWRP